MDINKILSEANAARELLFGIESIKLGTFLKTLS